MLQLIEVSQCTAQPMVWMNTNNSVSNIPGSGSALTTRVSISGRNLGHSPEADAIGCRERNATASWPTESDVLMVLVVVVVRE